MDDTLNLREGGGKFQAPIAALGRGVHATKKHGTNPLGTPGFSINGVYLMENPNLKWMMTGGTPILGNHQIPLEHLASAAQTETETIFGVFFLWPKHLQSEGIWSTRAEMHT